MDKEEIKKVVLNMFSEDKKESARLDISEVSKYSGEYADYESEVTVSGIDPNSKITNTKWHQENNYEIDFNSSSSKFTFREEKVVLKKDGIRTHLKINFTD